MLERRKLTSLIEKYNRGECTPHEKELLEKYLESFQGGLNEWNETQMGDRQIIEEKIFTGIKEKINKEKTTRLTQLFFSPSLLKRAASIVFFLILGSGILYVSGVFKQKANPVAWYEKVTKPGETAMIELTDGSRITVNADSRLRYPSHFNNALREVYLKGEAYFEVQRNIKKPFIVHSDNLATTVLGTTFDISAYPENKSISISLLEGSVKISRDDKSKIDELAVLEPKEQMLYNKENKVSTFNEFDSVQVVGWKNNIYKFENEELRKVLPQLERAFGVKLTITDPPVLAQKITIKFEKATIHTVADAIKNLTGLNYKIVNNTDKKEFIFYKKGK